MLTCAPRREDDMRPFQLVLVLGAVALVVVLNLASPARCESNEATGLTSCSGVSTLCELVKIEAKRTGLDPALVDAVIKIESDYQPNKIGAAGEIGLMQVLPSTARFLGFGGMDTELAELRTNVRLGVTYLAKAWDLAHGDLCRALMK